MQTLPLLLLLLLLLSNSLCLIVQEYVPLEGNRSNLVQTAWAMMGLIHAGQVSLLFKNGSLHIDIVLSYVFLE